MEKLFLAIPRFFILINITSQIVKSLRHHENMAWDKPKTEVERYFNFETHNFVWMILLNSLKCKV